MTARGVIALVVALVLVGGAFTLALRGGTTDEPERTQPRRSRALEVRPVLSTGPSGCTVPDEAAPDETVTAPDASGATCYELGPHAVRFSGEAVARSQPEDDSWYVELRFDPEPAAALDLAAGACFERVPQCPTGRLAMTVGGEVVSAPEVQAPEFGGMAVLHVGFSQAEAEALAAAVGT